MVNNKKIKQRQKYVEKVFNEFIKNGWDTTKLNKQFTKNTIKSQKAFDKFKEFIRKQRTYFKEREKIKKDYNTYIKKRDAERDKRQKQKLVEHFGKGSKEIRQIWADRKILNLTNADFNDKDRIQKKVASKFESDFTNQLSYFDKKGEEKQIGGLFKKHKDDRGVMLNLTEIYGLLEKDNNSYTNARNLIDYVYEKLIPLYYEGQNEMPPIYGKDRKAPDKFFKEVSKKMLDYYKNELL